MGSVHFIVHWLCILDTMSSLLAYKSDSCYQPVGSLWSSWAAETGFDSSVSVWSCDFLDVHFTRQQQQQQSTPQPSSFSVSDSGFDSTATDILTDCSSLAAFLRPVRSASHRGRRCWGESLQMSRRRSRLRRKRWACSVWFEKRKHGWCAQKWAFSLVDFTNFCETFHPLSCLCVLSY